MPENNKIIEYGVCKKIEEKIPEPVLLFRDKNKAKNKAKIIKSCAKKHKFSVYCIINKKNVNWNVFYALTAKVSSFYPLKVRKIYYNSKEKIDFLVKTASALSVEIKFISSETPLGKEFLMGFGGIGAFRRD